MQIVIPWYVIRHLLPVFWKLNEKIEQFQNTKKKIRIVKFEGVPFSKNHSTISAPASSPISAYNNYTFRLITKIEFLKLKLSSLALYFLLSLF